MAEGDGLLNRYTGSNPYPGFESPSLRFRNFEPFDERVEGLSCRSAESCVLQHQVQTDHFNDSLLFGVNRSSLSQSATKPWYIRAIIN